ncbi:hypothetical protein [Haloglycomyces albus]|uniref:hypothetical protein n=1 Tax=Haloglycomyces albus TaxID=526067 RepID=UPI00046CF2F0|nr:hypothetical protein [Haloglycomyces albus]
MLRDFVTLVGEPEIDPGPPQYEKFSNETGINLPDDYCAWAAHYSALEVCNELLVANFLSHRERWTTRNNHMSVLRGLRAARDATPEARVCVFDAANRPIGPQPWPPLYPEKGGLFYWGGDQNGAMYLWDTRNQDPNRWTVVVYDGTWQEFECGFLSFLVKLLQGEFRESPMFIEGWPWIPAIKEARPLPHGEIDWHVPARWASYFEEYEERQNDVFDDWEDLSWVDRYR